MIGFRNLDRVSLPVLCLTLPCLTSAAHVLGSRITGFDRNPSTTDACLSQSEPSEAQLDSIERLAYGDVTDLSEVIITAETPMVKVSADRVTYDVDEDPTSAGQTVLEMLRKVPMVSVDGQDNIKVKGKGDFKIYVNGHPEPMLSQNASVVLKTMPAESVARIELITDPGAQYDAEGSEVIINLITERKQKTTGYNGSLNANIGNRMYMLGGRFASKFDKVTMQTGINFMQSFKRAQTGKINDEIIYFNDERNHRMTTTSESPRSMKYISADLGLSWDASANDLFTFSASYYRVGLDILIDPSTATMYDIKGAPVWSYTLATDIDMKYDGATANASYQHLFGRQDNFLAASYQFNFVRMSTPIDKTFGECINYTPRWLYEHDDNKTFTREHTMQIDYSNTLSPHSRIEFGAKGIFRRNSASNRGYAGDDIVLARPVPELGVEMRQPQDIYSLYGVYTATYGTWQGIAGVRYEHTRMGIRYPWNPENDFTKNMDDVVPNASITYNFSPMHNISAKYSMKITRPGIEQLNPYRLSTGGSRSQQGNPSLTSERVNNISLSYSNFGRTVGGSLSLDYTRTGNAITGFSFSDKDEIVSTYANIGRQQSVSLNGFLMWSPTNKLRLTLNAGLVYTDMLADFSNSDSGTVNLSNKGWSGNLTFNGDWRLPEKFTLGAYAGLNTPSVRLQGESGYFHFYGLSLSRTLLRDDSLKLTLSGQNCFEKWMIFKNTTTTTEFKNTQEFHNPAWGITLSASWTFGHNKVKVKDINRSIKNDDISNAKSGDNGGAAGRGIGM